MKILACTKPIVPGENLGGDIITIAEALRMRETDPEHWEVRTFYDIIRSRPMIAVRRRSGERDSSSFSFKSGVGIGHGRGSKGIAHELAQEYLCRQKVFRFTAYNQEFEVGIDHAEDEVLIVDAKRPTRRAYVDVMLYLKSDCPTTVREIFGDRIAVEIDDTHESTRRKKRLFRDLRISALSVRVPPDWHIPNDADVARGLIERVRFRISRFWPAQIPTHCIFAPGRIVPEKQPC